MTSLPTQLLLGPATARGFAAGDGAVDWVALGLALAIAGSFLLANAILMRHPRDLVREHFGADRRRLGSIRGYVFHRVQVALGFLLLLLGFALQLVGRYGGSGAEGAAESFPIGWIGLIVLLVGGLQLAGWWLSQALFRVYVIEYVRERNADLETDSGLAREVGELFGIEMLPEDTVRGYVARLREKLSLPAGPTGDARGLRNDPETAR